MFHVKQSGDWRPALRDLRARASELSLTLTPEQLQRLEDAAQALAKVAAASGMSGYESPHEVLARAMAPALAYFAFPEAPRSGHLADLGAGIGALGATLAIVAPEMSVHLIDRAQRAFTACELLIGRLQIANLRARLLDAERQAANLPAYDAVVFRALAPGPEALALASQLLVPEGFVAAWHREGDASFRDPPGALTPVGSAQTAVEGLVVSGYRFCPH